MTAKNANMTFKRVFEDGSEEEDTEVDLCDATYTFED
jgi:hypothetical protein